MHELSPKADFVCQTDGHQQKHREGDGGKLNLHAGQHPSRKERTLYRRRTGRAHSRAPDVPLRPRASGPAAMAKRSGAAQHYQTQYAKNDGLTPLRGSPGRGCRSAPTLRSTLRSGGIAIEQHSPPAAFECTGQLAFANTPRPLAREVVASRGSGWGRDVHVTR